MVNFEQFGREVASAAAGLADSATQFAGEVGESVSNASEGLARFKRFNETGHDLFISGAVTSHGGNLSEADGVNIWISRRDSMLGRLSSGDIVKTAWTACDSDEGCSRELVVHRAMYFGYAQRANLEPGQFRAAIVHAHTRHTILRSLIEDTIVPLDSEGLYVLGNGIKVFAPAVTIESQEAANMLGEAIYNGANIAIIKGHGPFAIAPSIEQAFQLISCLEASCEILDLMDARSSK